MIRKLADLLRDLTFPHQDRHWGVPCFAGAAIAAVIWITIDRIRQFDQPGSLLAPLGWSLVSLVVSVVMGGAIGLAGGWFERRWRRRHAEGIQAASDALGFNYSAIAAALRSLGSQLPMLRNWHQSDHLMSGERDGVQVDVFDLTSRWTGTDSAGYSHRTIVVLPADGLPDFDIVPRTFLMFGKWSGLQFEATDATSEADAAAIAGFTRRCAVSCGYTGEDGLMTSPKGTPEAEQAARHVLTPTVMHALTPLADWWIESRAGRLALCRGRGFRPATERAEMIDEALAIRLILVPNGFDGGAR